MQEWKKCSRCKKSIGLGEKYFVCSVSSCNSKRTGYVFCSVSCWDTHVPIARHKDAGAIEKIAPKVAESTTESSSIAASASGTRRIIRQPSSEAKPSNSSAANIPKDILIVVSKLKDYVRARSEMNTSGDVAAVLSEAVRQLCDDAIEQARMDGRKTVMGRDFK